MDVDSTKNAITELKDGTKTEQQAKTRHCHKTSSERNARKHLKHDLNSKFGRKWLRDDQKFSGRVPVPQETISKYNYAFNIKSRPFLSRAPHQTYKRHKMLHKNEITKKGIEDTARAELLLTGESGCLEAADGFAVTSLTQRDIVAAADITTQKKCFSLHLPDFGPYMFQYYRDGRRLALAGELGHVAVFDPLTKQLFTEINVMESLHDVAFLQDCRTIAVAQKKWTSVYDNNGTEIHCVKPFHEIIKLDYLPYHFLLAGLSENGWLHYLDVSLGKEASAIKMKTGRALTMAHNPYNGVISSGHVGGVVCHWTPNMQEPVATVLCHKSPVFTLAYDPAGRYLVTASQNREVRVYDARRLGRHLHSYSAGLGLRHLTLSQTGLLALGFQKHVQVVIGLNESDLTPYLTHNCLSVVQQLQFCPFEDTLGISTLDSFSSIVVPGSGEANFDALEVNPFSSRSGSNEALIKGLLQKIPADLITLDPTSLTKVDQPTWEEKMSARRKLLRMETPKVIANVRYKMKGKGGSAATARRKMIKKDMLKRRHLNRLESEKRDAGLAD